MTTLLIPKTVAVEIKYFLESNQTKVNFKDGNKKLFLGVNSLNNNLKIIEGTNVLRDNEIIIGSSEAAMMKREKLIEGVGDNLTNFFGLPSVKVVGILKPTGTELDSYHLVNINTFNELTGINK